MFWRLQPDILFKLDTVSVIEIIWPQNQLSFSPMHGLNWGAMKPPRSCAYPSPQSAKLHSSLRCWRVIWSLLQLEQRNTRTAFSIGISQFQAATISMPLCLIASPALLMERFCNQAMASITFQCVHRWRELVVTSTSSLPSRCFCAICNLAWL